jgi:hypothetical protein
MVRINKRAEEPSQPEVLPSQRLALKLSGAQRHTILNYAELPADLAERLSVQPDERGVQFTLDELDALLDRVEIAVHRAKGNEKQKVLRIVQKLAGPLGSEITPSRRPRGQTSKKAPTVFQIKMTLNGIEPPIWRRVQTKDCTLEDLHALIQVTMGWEFEHLYRFTIGGVDYGDLGMTSDEEGEDACGTYLSAILPAENRRPRFSYEYDFGDGWIHRLIVEERFPPRAGVKYPICVVGQRASPPEDSGGPWAYSDFVEALNDPGHRRHAELLEWVGGEFDPERFDVQAVNNELRRLRTRKP